MKPGGVFPCRLTHISFTPFYSYCDVSTETRNAKLAGTVVARERLFKHVLYEAMFQ
jgi:hypothetical protein